MSGTINLALTQQFDMDGRPLSGGLLYFFVASTTTPQSAFQDTALTIVYPNPITLDASGRVPMFYLADGNIKIRLADKNGVTVIAADNLLVIGPSAGGGGGGGGVDVTTVLATGDIKTRYGTGTLDGFVRCNGLTIGQTGSSATELAGLKAQALYEYLWAFPNIALDGATKGATANADFLALRRLVLPDLRGRTIAGMDDMGSSGANRLTAAGLGAGVTALILGNAGGLEKLTSAQVLGHVHNLRSNVLYSGSLTISVEQDANGAPQDHTHGWGSSGQAGSNGQIDNVTGRFLTISAANSGFTMNHHHTQTAHTALGGITGGGGAVNAGANTTDTGDTDLDHSHKIDMGGITSGRSAGHYHSISGTTENNNASVTAQINVPPTMVMTVYIKL